MSKRKLNTFSLILYFTFCLLKKWIGYVITLNNARKTGMISQGYANKYVKK